MPQEKLTTKIIKLVFGGQGFARIEDPASPHDGKPAFIWNGLPEEEVEFQITKAKKSFVEGIVTKVIKPSPKRVEPKEAHYASCSPFQVLEYAEENKQKVEICKDAFERIGKMSKDFPLLKNLEITAPEKEYGYRNKIEYNFTESDDGLLQFAFFERNQLTKIPIEPCVLAKPEINKVAERVLEFVRHNSLSSSDLKSTVIRANEKGEVIAGLFLKAQKDPKEMSAFPEFDETLKGFHIYFSDNKEPLYTDGQDFLVHEVNGMNLKYGLNSFFQVNQEIFEEALKEIDAQLAKYTDQSPLDLVDLYSGVGAISLPISAECDSVTLVDNSQEAIKFAKENIYENKIENAKVHCAEAERNLQIISQGKTIILDPPRSGLHENLTRRLLKETPKTIIYLSCNASTQARDIYLLSGKYTVTYMKLFNFFPKTPHVESLCVLRRK
jgi:23S rRNA (uracil1939-C5)-methyltransferase